MGLNDFDATPLQDAVDVANLPEQMGGQKPLLPMGPYRFALSPLKDANFEKVTSEQYGARAKVKFDEHAPLVVVQSVGGEHDREPFETSLSNVPRRRGKGEDAPIASDWDYLNQALGIQLPTPRTNKAYVDSLLATSASRAEFAADIEHSWSCNPNRDAYFDDGQGGRAVVLNTETGQNFKGCGKKYYPNSPEIQDQKVNGKLPERIRCANPACNASIRGFANLTRFRA